MTTAGNNVDVPLPPVSQPENPGSININMLKNLVKDAIVEILPTFLRPSSGVSLIPPNNNIIIHLSVSGSPSFQSDSQLLYSTTNVQPVSGSTLRVHGVAGQSVQVMEDNIIKQFIRKSSLSFSKILRK